jgi:hypothetical protein
MVTTWVLLSVKFKAATCVLSEGDFLDLYHLLCSTRADVDRSNINPMHDDSPSVPSHEAQFAKDTTLESDLIAFAKQCLVTPVAQAGPAAPDRPAFRPEHPPHVPLPQEETGKSCLSSFNLFNNYKTHCMEEPHAARPAVLQPDGSPFRRWINEHITHTLLQGMKLLREHEPEKPLKALGEFFLGNVAMMALEASDALAAMQVKPDEPKKWYGKYLLARSAEFEG